MQAVMQAVMQGMTKRSSASLVPCFFAVPLKKEKQNLTPKIDIYSISNITVL